MSFLEEYTLLDELGKGGFDSVPYQLAISN